MPRKIIANFDIKINKSAFDKTLHNETYLYFSSYHPKARFVIEIILRGNKVPVLYKQKLLDTWSVL